MAASSIADLLLSPTQTFTVVEQDKTSVTLDDGSGATYVLPKTVVAGTIKVGEAVVMSIRSRDAVERVSQMVAKEVLQEMLKDDQ